MIEPHFVTGMTTSEIAPLPELCPGCTAKDRQVEELQEQSEKRLQWIAELRAEIAELRKWIEDGRAAEKRKDEEIAILKAHGQAEGNRLREAIEELKASHARKDEDDGSGTRRGRNTRSG